MNYHTNQCCMDDNQHHSWCTISCRIMLLLSSHHIMKKLLTLLLSLSVLGTSFALTPAEETQIIDQVSSAIEKRIENGDKTREEFITVLNAIVEWYPQYKTIFAPIRDRIVAGWQKPKENKPLWEPLPPTSSGWYICRNYTRSYDDGGMCYAKKNTEIIYDTKNTCCKIQK